jgi:hypothetical protein
MIERVLPEPDRFATCPLDGKVLDYYRDTFESVFVLLHPFLRPVSVSKDIFSSGMYPDRTVIASNCEAVRWKSVMAIAGLPSLAAVDIGLRTQIGGLNEEVSNKDYAARIAKLFDSHGIVRPDEGHFSDLNHDDVLDFVRGLGQKWLWVGDEHCTERRLYWIDDLKAVNSRVTGSRCNVFTPDKSLLWTTHWDSHFSFLCGSTADLGRLLEHDKLEGFFCTVDTQVYWSVHDKSASQPN